MLESQITQQLSSSSTPPSLPSKPKLNPKEHCDCIAWRSGRQLEGPKGAKVEKKRENGHDEGITTLPSANEPQEKSESKKFKESKSPSLKPYMPPLHPTKICKG